MTNEQIVIAIKQGDASLYEALWEQVYKLLYLMATRYYNRHTERCSACGITLDDLKQECYTIMLDSIKAYDEEKEFAFTSYFNYHAKNRYNDVLGYRTVKKSKDPLTNAISLDTSIGDTEDCALADTIEDKDIYKQFEQIELTDIQRIMREEIAKLDSQYQKIIDMHYYQELFDTQIANILASTPEKIRTDRSRALKRLRLSSRLRPLRNEFMTHYSVNLISTFIYSGEFVKVVEHIEKLQREGAIISYGKRQAIIHQAEIAYVETEQEKIKLAV